MSFWKSFGFHSVTALDQLLDSGNFTLEQLMDEEDILQEVKGQNKKLIDFLVEEPSLKKLLVYVTEEAPEDSDQKRKFKYPFIACEILASEVWALCDAFYAHAGLLEKLYGFLEKDPPLNPMLTSYTCRVAAILLSKKIPETIGFLKGKKDIIPLFIKHLGNASIMDLLLKIISAQDPLADNPNQTLDWLCTTELIPSLIKKMDPKSSSEEVIENASQALVDIITASNSVPNSPLIDQLESQDMLKQLLESMLSSGFSPALLHGSSVLIHLLARHAQAATDDKPLEQLPVLLQQIASRLSDVRDLLQSGGSSSGKSEQNGNNNIHSLPIYHSSVGDITPLGFHRLRLIEFLGALVTTNYQCIDMLLLQLNIFTLCLDLFFAHPWNNFLHQAVFGMLEGIYSGKHDKLKVALIVECKLLDRLTAVVREEDISTKNGGLRKGFMGHVTKMSVILIDAAKEDEKLQTLLNEHKAWQEYVAGSLRETQVKEQVAAEYLAHQAALQQSQLQQQDQGDENVEEQVDDRIDTTESE